MTLACGGAVIAVAAEDALFEEGVVGEESLDLVIDGDGVIGDEIIEDGVIEEGIDDSQGGWAARRITPRDVAGRQAFIRQTSDAYVDPDQPGSLELKYYFDLGEEPLSIGGQFDRIRPIDPDAPVRLDRDEDYEGPSGLFPLSIGNAAPDLAGEWIDYRSKLRPRQVVLLTGSASPDAGLQMLACRVRTSGANQLLVRDVDARRTVDASELIEGVSLTAAMDTWDKPSLLGNGSAFLGRVVAIAKDIDGRYAVDFYGEMLHEDSDCRVWLTDHAHPLGRPVGIRFIEVPIRKDADRVADVAVMGVTYVSDEGATYSIAFDFPMCESPVMAGLRQMAKLLEAADIGDDSERQGQDLETIIGPDLLDEFSRRLVNARYR
jgi:hypothetical protein